MIDFARSTITLGQKYEPSVYIDIRQLLPSNDTVRSEVIKLNKKIQIEFNKELTSIIESGGGDSCDGVKVECNGQNYYDLFINYLKIERKSLVDGGGIHWKICTRLMFTSAHVGSESAECLRETIEKNLLDTTGFKLNSFEKNFTFVTDCAPVMAKTFGASVSPKKIPILERWVGCITQQLNTVMKSVIESDEI